MTNNNKLRRIKLLGTYLTLCSDRELLREIRRIVERNGKGMVLSGNVHSFNIAFRTRWYRAFMNRADIVRLDGTGLILAAKLLGYRNVPRRITWADFGWDLAAFCEDYNFSLFLLGGEPGVAEKAAERFKEKFPEIQITSAHHGYFKKAVGHPENERVIQAINAVKPNVLIIGFGMPVQERWLYENYSRLEVNVVLTGGAVFDYISGMRQRGPRWMTNNGLEWLARLIIEPKRLWKRYLLGNPLFLLRVLRFKTQAR